jgi:acetylornithine deacetylase/succinyl-diaminopimelate desuccinylase-like protein
VADLLGGLGLEVEIIPTALHPVILATRGGDPSWPHVVIYGHYDVQPADPVDLWTTPPFEPVERDGRIFGRGAADNKGPFMVHVAAVASLLEEHPDLPLRLTFLVEGEEEIGSPSLEDFLKAHLDRLQGDFVLLSDTGSPNEEQVVITAGLRGIITLEAALTGAAGDLHSGMNGGAFLNPIQAVTELCASLHDADGRVGHRRLL